jgi:hypothetical protein
MAMKHRRHLPLELEDLAQVEEASPGATISTCALITHGATEAKRPASVSANRSKHCLVKDLPHWES